MELHHQYAVHAGDLDVAHGVVSCELRELGSTGPNSELADPLSRVRLPTRAQRDEVFVDVIMTVQHHFSTRLVEVVPEGSHRGLVAMDT